MKNPAIPTSAATFSKFSFSKYFPWLVFLYSFVLYMNTLQHDFVLDDAGVITLNKYTRKGFEGIVPIFSHGYWHGFNGSDAGAYRPVPVSFMAIVYALFGFNASAFHFFNVLFYAFTAWTLYHLLKKILTWKHSEQDVSYLSFIITLTFIAHPVHTEVVSNIKSMDEILCFLFFIISLTSLVNYINNNETWLLWVAAFYYFLSLLSKETAITFVMIVPLVLLFFSPLSSKRIIRITILFLGVGLIYLVIRNLVLTDVGSGISHFDRDYINNPFLAAPNFSIRLASGIKAVGLYVKLLFFPHPLLYDYSYKHLPLNDWTDPWALLSLMGMICLIGYGIYHRYNKPVFSFIVFYFLVTISIVSNIFILIGSNFGERFLYAPSLAFAMALGSGLYFIRHHFQLSVWKCSLFFLPLLMIYSVKTLSRNQVWKDNFTLFSHDISYLPNNARAHRALAAEYVLKAQVVSEPDAKMSLTDSAVRYAHRAIDIFNSYEDAWNDLGAAFFNAGKIDSAEAAWSKIKRLNESYYKEKGLDSLLCLGYLYQGMQRGAKKEYASSIKYLEKAVNIGADQEEAWYNLGGAYFTVGDFEKAKFAWEKTLKINPHHAMAKQGLNAIPE